MDKKKVGIRLKTRREELKITSADMAKKIGCDRTTVERQEKGLSTIRKGKMRTIANAYEIDPEEFAELCGFSVDELPSLCNTEDLEVSATVEDLEFLITVVRGLEKPMNIRLILELLKCRGKQCG